MPGVLKTKFTVRRSGGQNMTIGRTFFAFRTADGTSLVNTIRRFWLHAMLAGWVCASSIAMQPDQAQAAQALAVPATDPRAASMEAVKKCAGATCTMLGMRVDPADPSVSSLHLE